jgi:hypothetical protein
VFETGKVRFHRNHPAGVEQGVDSLRCGGHARNDLN